MKDLQELIKELKINYTGKDISIRTEGSLRLSMQIHNTKSIVTNNVILISNSELALDEEIEINIDDINSIEIDTEVMLEMNGNYTIYIIA